MKPWPQFGQRLATRHPPSHLAGYPGLRLGKRYREHEAVRAGDTPPLCGLCHWLRYCGLGGHWNRPIFWPASRFATPCLAVVDLAATARTVGIPFDAPYVFTLPSNRCQSQSWRFAPAPRSLRNLPAPRSLRNLHASTKLASPPPLASATAQTGARPGCLRASRGNVP
jgi:hypothetical protein